MSPLLEGFLKTAMAPALGLVALCLLSMILPLGLRVALQSLFFASCFVAGNFLLIDRLQFPPHDFAESASWIAACLALFVIVAPAEVGSRFLLRAVFVLLAGWMVLWFFRSGLSSMVHKRNAMAFFFLALGIWSILEKASTKVHVVSLLTLPLLSIGGLSFLILLKGSALMAQELSILGALVAGQGLLGLIFGKRISGLAFVPFLSVLVVCFMAAGHFYLGINPWYMVILSFPYFVLWVFDFIPFLPKSPLSEAVVLIFISAGPLLYFLSSVYKSIGPLY